jgi:hypothetical protein
VAPSRVLCSETDGGDAMGWRGTVRSLGAIARQAERDSMRRAREHARHVATMEKLDAKERAAEAVKQFEEYVERLVIIHRTCSSSANWNARAAAPPPNEPQRTSEHEASAKRNLERYKPSLVARLLGRVEKQRDVLGKLVEQGRLADDRSFVERSGQYKQDMEDHRDGVAFARRVLQNEPSAMLEAVKLFEPLASIGLLGEHLSVSVIGPKAISVELSVHGEEVIPKDRAKLLASGRASVKPMPKGEYYRLYQDHVCSAALRVAREFLALLPIDDVVVTAVDDLVDPATGHLKRSPIVSFHAPRATMAKLNFHALDPSDSLRNFNHRMSFGATVGLRPVEPVNFPSAA